MTKIFKENIFIKFVIDGTVYVGRTFLFENLEKYVAFIKENGEPCYVRFEDVATISTKLNFKLLEETEIKCKKPFFYKIPNNVKDFLENGKTTENLCLEDLATISKN